MGCCEQVVDDQAEKNAYGKPMEPDQRPPEYGQYGYHGIELVEHYNFIFSSVSRNFGVERASRLQHALEVGVAHLNGYREAPLATF